MSAPTDQSLHDTSRLPAATTAAAEARVTEPATFAFADIAGFTALTEAHGDEQAAELVAEFCRAVQSELPASGGSQVKSIESRGRRQLRNVPEQPERFVRSP